ncbi:hypothetical protein VTH06DRAFT_8186 [Thermothelomyces fergusii]
MDDTISTVYPPLQAADPSRVSLADLPLETVLQILDSLFEPQQLIVIDIYGSGGHNNGSYGMQSTVSSQTKVILRPPPLHVTATACRLFRHMYGKSRPTVWGAHLTLRRAYHVSLERDIFYVRFHRKLSFVKGDPLLDPLYMILDGIQNLATSVNYICLGACVLYFLHMNPRGKTFSILIPVPDLERNVDPACGELQLAPTWRYFREMFEGDMSQRALHFIPQSEEQRALWKRTWRLCPAPKLREYVVDECRLNNPIISGLSDRVRYMRQLYREE